MANSDVDEELDEVKPAELRGVTVHEISLVDRPANKRPFLLFKREDTPIRERGEEPVLKTLTKEQTEELQAVLNTEGKDEEKLLEKVDGKSKNAAKAALRILQHLTGDMEAEDLQKLMADAGFGFEKAEEKVAEEKPKEVAKDEPDEKPEPDAISKAHLTELEKRDEKIVELEKFQAEMVAKADADAVEKLVDEMQIPGMSREDQIVFVKAMPADQRKAMVGWAEALRTSKELGDPTKGVGTPRRGEHADESAQDEIMKRAKALVDKDTTGKTKTADAVVRVMRDDKDLAARNRAETLGIGG